eukprot:gene31621-23849_t
MHDYSQNTIAQRSRHPPPRYTGVVFEAFDRAGALRAICGGGRYDHLMSETYGHSQQIPACGFGFGDCVIPELRPGVQDLVIPHNDS